MRILNSRKSIAIHRSSDASGFVGPVAEAAGAGGIAQSPVAETVGPVAKAAGAKGVAVGPVAEAAGAEGVAVGPVAGAVGLVAEAAESEGVGPFAEASVAVSSVAEAAELLGSSAFSLASRSAEAIAAPILDGWLPRCVCSWAMPRRNRETVRASARSACSRRERAGRLRRGASMEGGGGGELLCQLYKRTPDA